MYQRYNNLISDLIPTYLYSKVVLDDPNDQTKIIPQLKAKDGTMIASGLPPKWMRYIQEAINNYYKANKEVKKEYIKSDLIVAFVIPGQPMEKKDGSAIKRDKNGQYAISYNPEYTKRINYVNNILCDIIKGRAHMLPITDPVCIEQVFYVKKKGPKKFNLSELIASNLVILDRLDIIKSCNTEVANNYDGSRVIYTKNDPKTVVRIKRLPEK